MKFIKKVNLGNEVKCTCDICNGTSIIKDSISLFNSLKKDMLHSLVIIKLVLNFYESAKTMKEKEMQLRKKILKSKKLV